MTKLVFAGLAAAAAVSAALPLWAQENAHEAATAPAPPPPPPQAGGRALGPQVGQPVPSGYAAFPVNPAMVERGKSLFSTSCASCHAMDIRGTDNGPNLRRSTYVINDLGNGKMVGVVVRESLGHKGQFADLSDDASADLTHYMKSFPPRGQGSAEIGIPAVFTVGAAAAGKTYFTAHCASCHAVAPGAASASVNLSGIASRITDPKTLQQTWLSPTTTKPTLATVTLKDGSKLTAPTTAAGEFTVTLNVNGAPRVIDRKDATKIEMTYPLAAHARLLTSITDTNIHDVTGYLVTLK